MTQPKAGMRVRISKLESTKGMLVHQRHLSVRSVGQVGTVTGWVPGHGGDVWWVQHDSALVDVPGVIGAYCYTELDELE